MELSLLHKTLNYLTYKEMNINEPNTSRQLAALIQGVKGEHREQFIKDAKEAKDMESFIKHFLKSYE